MLKNLLLKLTSKYRWEIYFLLASSAIHALLFLLPTQLAYGDLAPFPETWQQGFTDFFYAWRDISFGLYRHPGNITNLIQSLLILLSFGSSLIAQKIYIIFLLPFLAFISARLLLKKHFGATDNIFLFITAFFYTFSPTMLTEFIGGTLYSTMLIFAIFPYLASLTLDLILDNNSKSAIKLILVLGLLFSVDVQLIIIYGIFIIITILGILISQPLGKGVKGLIQLFRKVAILLGIVILAMAANPIYSLSNFLVVNPSFQFENDNGFLNNLNVFIRDVKYTYSRSSFNNTIRLGSNLSDFKYTGYSWWTTPFLLISLITLIYSVYLFKKVDTKRRIFIVGYILISLFIYLTYLQYTYPIFLHFPVLFIFRNPAKLTLLNTLFFCVCFYNVFNNINLKFQKQIYWLIYISLLIYIWPIFLGDRGLSYSRNTFTIPKDYYSILQTIKKDPHTKNFRSIWLPSTYENHSIKLTWLDRGRIEDQLGLNEFSTDNYGNYIVSAISNAVIKNDGELFNKLIKAADVQYLILTKDDKIARQNGFYDSVTLDSGYKKLDGFLASNSIVFDNKYYRVYRLSDTLPLISTLNNVIELNYNIGNSVKILEQYFKSYNTILVKTSDPINEVISAKVNPDELSNYVLEWDDLWSPPNPTISPQNPIFPLLMFKEKVGFNLRQDVYTKINFATWIIYTRAEEIKKYEIQGNTLNELIDNINYYKKYLNDYYNKNKATTDLQRDTAMKTLVFLSKAKENLSSDQNILDDLITQLNKIIDEGYKNLCSAECIKVNVSKSGTYYQLGNQADHYNLEKGQNMIQISNNINLLSSATSPLSNYPLVYNIPGLQPYQKYFLEFDYNTHGSIYELSLFDWFRQVSRVKFIKDEYLHYKLTSDIRSNKHFKAFFEPQYHLAATSYLKIEEYNPVVPKNIEITNLKIMPVIYNGLVLTDKIIPKSEQNSEISNVNFIKISPSHYRIYTNDLKNDYLLFAVNYNPAWKLFDDKKMLIKNVDHKMAMTYGNLWKLNTNSINNSKYIDIIFVPQNILIYSIAGSTLFFMGTVILLLSRRKIN